MVCFFGGRARIPPPTNSLFLSFCTVQGQTLLCSLLASNSILQVHRHGLRMIRPDRRLVDWRPQSGRTIASATANEHQVLIALDNHQLIYFELDINTAAGALVDSAPVDLKSEILGISLPPLPSHVRRSDFAAVALKDRIILMSLRGGALQNAAMQMLQEPPNSVALLYAGTPAPLSQSTQQSSLSSQIGTLFMLIGTRDGILIRTRVNTVQNTLEVVNRRFLGTQPVRLFPTAINGFQACVAMSSRPWIVASTAPAIASSGGESSLSSSTAASAVPPTALHRLACVPMLYPPLRHMSAFATNLAANAMVSVVGSQFRIISVDFDPLASSLSTSPATSLQLRYTPRRMLQHPHLPQMLMIAEWDARCVNWSTRRGVEDLSVAADSAAATTASADDDDMMDIAQPAPPPPPTSSSSTLLGDYDPEWDSKLQDRQWGVPLNRPGFNAACLRIVDCSTPTMRTVHVHELDNNEVPLSMCCAQFAIAPEHFLIVGTAQDLEPESRRFSACFLRLYRFYDSGRRLQLVHKTPLDCLPTAIASFHRRLLVCCGTSVRLYELGRKQFLRKFDGANLLASSAQSVQVQGNRIAVTDVMEGVHVLQYRRTTKQIVLVADQNVS